MASGAHFTEESFRHKRALGLYKKSSKSGGGLDYGKP